MFKTLPSKASLASARRLTLRGVSLRVAFLLAALVAASASASAQVASGSPDLVISQVYTRGGEAGATYRNDFIEIFNRGTSTVNLHDYTLHIATTGPGATDSVIFGFVGTIGTPIAPGQYRLFQLGSSGNNGSLFPFPADSANTMVNLGSTSGRIALVKTPNFTQLFGCPVGIDPSVYDLVAYGATASCAEGGAPAAAPTTTAAAFRLSDGCTDTDNNAADLPNAPPNPRPSIATINPCAPSASLDTVQFESAQTDTTESVGSVEIFVTRSGDTTTPATVQYATIDGEATSLAGSASDRNDYTTAIGTLRFAAGETRKSFRLLITDDVYPEGLHALTVALGSPSPNVGLGAQSTTTVNIADTDTGPEPPNPINSTPFFVRQHYADFLNRDPDAPGFAFWTGQIDECETRPEAERQGCREVRRINVSAAFFRSIEFQETGYLVYRAYKASYPDSAQRPRGFPTYREFEHDAQDTARGVIIGQPGAEQLLEQNRQLFFNEFVARPEFTLRYPATLTAAQFVDALNANAGGALSTAERDALVAGLGSGAETRATALRRIADDEDFRVAEFNRAFVLTEYFGYLRRSPNEAPDFNFVGYDFWLTKLNNHNGNFITAEMVKGFITSGEYRARFGSQ